MAKAKNPITLSKAFNVPERAFAELGVLNATLAIDTQLFIDPALLQVSAHAEIRTDAARAYREHFERVIQLLAASREVGDPAWRAAERMLNFPEVAGTCLGYGAGSIRGRAFGPNLTGRIVRVASQIVEIGVRDPDLFTALALFEEDVGPDLISDMTTNVIFAPLAAFNQRVLRSLELQGEQFERNGVRGAFLRNPFQDVRTPVILLPMDVLRELPVAGDWDGVASAAAQNEQLRREVNEHIGHIWERKAKRDKAELKEQVLASRVAFETLLQAIKTVGGRPYDVARDPEGLVRWASVAQQITAQHPLTFAIRRATSIDDVLAVVREIIVQFRHLIERAGLNKELYRDAAGDPRHESTAQRLFFAVAYSYCKANNVDISPEIDVGTGKIDFKFAAGFDSRVLVEVKLSTNGKILEGYTTQLEVYREAQETTRAVYLVIDVGRMGQKDQALVNLRDDAQRAGRPLSDLEFVDGTLKEPASRRRG